MTQDPILPTLKTFIERITIYQRLDESIRANWRYKHKQAALKEPRRQAFRLADAQAAKLAEILSEIPETGFIEKQAARLYELWEQSDQARIAYFTEKSDDTLGALKSSEKLLKQQIQAVGEILKKTAL